MYSSNRQTLRLMNYLVQEKNNEYTIQRDTDKNTFELCEWNVHFFLCAR